MNELQRHFVKQPLALPGSAKYMVNLYRIRFFVNVKDLQYDNFYNVGTIRPFSCFQKGNTNL